MKKVLKDINYSSILKRLALLVFPTILMPLGVACYYLCGFGADPFSIFVDGEHILFNLSYGQITTINNLIILAVMLVVGRKYLNLGTIITAFSTGPLIDLFRNLLITYVISDNSAIWLKVATLGFAVVSFAIGVGIYIAVDLGVGAVDFIGLIIIDKTHFKLKYVRIALDAIFVVVGFLMGGKVGMGTIVGIACTGPIISIVIKLTKDRIEKFAGSKKICLEEIK